MLKVLTKILKWAFVVSLLVFGLTLITKNRYPSLKNIDPRLYEEPQQTPTDSKSIKVQKADGTYEIVTKFNYDLYGMVVSTISNEGFFHQFLLDTMNTKDICLIWGDNILSKVYQSMNFKNINWACHIEFKTDAKDSDRSKFRPNKLSNNHLLPENDQVKKVIRQAQRGDQIHIQGYLIKYRIEGKSDFRNSSETRDDSLCEVVYVANFEILGKGSPILRGIFTFSIFSLIISFLLTILFGIINFFLSARPNRQPLEIPKDETIDGIKKEIEQKLAEKKARGD